MLHSEVSNYCIILPLVIGVGRRLKCSLNSLRFLGVIGRGVTGQERCERRKVAATYTLRLLSD